MKSNRKRHWNGATCNNCNGKRCTVCKKWKILTT